MPAATALVSGNDPTPQLAEEAVAEARARLGGAHANAVVLLLSPEFARHAATTVRAVARATQCTQIFGGVAAGLCNETGWVLDRPAAAVLLLTGGLALTAGDEGSGDDPPLLCCTSTPFPSEWANSRRCGFHFHGTSGQGAVWQSGRIAPFGSAEARIAGARCELVVAQGLRPLGGEQFVSDARAYDLLCLTATDGAHKHAHESALDSLLSALPPEWPERQSLPLHLVNAIIATADGDTRVAALLSANADRSLTLTETLRPGDRLRWAIRQPAHAEAEVRELFAARTGEPPDFALYFSCIGRGPYFHGGDDRDLAALVARHPGMPLLGAYGTGQIACSGAHSRQLQNAVVAALFTENPDVQPQS